MRALFITATLMVTPTVVGILGGAAILSTRRRVREYSTGGASATWTPRTCESCPAPADTERLMPAVDHYPATVYTLCYPCARLADVLTGIESSVGVR